MRSTWLIATALAWMPVSAAAAPLTAADDVAIRKVPQRFTSGWLHNDRNQVMGVFAPQAVFIPHDGVRPHIGWKAIDDFWFPKGGAAGTVTSFTMTVDSLSGAGDHAVIWGKSDLHWQDKTTAYHWPGYYLMELQRTRSKWLVTHLMSSDEQPTSRPVKSH